MIFVIFINQPPLRYKHLKSIKINLTHFHLTNQVRALSGMTLYLLSISKYKKKKELTLIQ